MEKIQLKKFVMEKTGVTGKEAAIIIDVIFKGIITGLAQDGKSTITNFGTFKTKRVKGRTARNPRSGETVYVPDRTVVRFKPAKKLKDFVLGL
jgi:nucleoid DNA-binding protein